MLRVVSDESEIQRAQRRFEDQLRQAAGQTIPVVIGRRGKSYPMEARWANDLGIWVCFKVISGSRYWNAFGTGRPRPGRSLSIVCEINFPLTGIDRRVAGAFAADDLGRTYVVHRGRIGGGRRGIGKELFETNCQGQWVSLDDGNVITDVALVGMLGTPVFPRDVSRFVFEVERVKGLVTQ